MNEQDLKTKIADHILGKMQQDGYLRQTQVSDIAYRFKVPVREVERAMPIELAFRSRTMVAKVVGNLVVLT